MATDLQPIVFIVEPRLSSAEGHEFEHALEFARALKRHARAPKVIVLSGPQNETLAAALRAQTAIDASHACFPARILGDWSTDRALFPGALRDAWALRRALGRFRAAQPLLIFDSLDVYRMLLLAFVRLLSPRRRIKAMGIARFDPLHADGTPKRQYRFLRDWRAGRLLAAVALKDTLIFTDSLVLQQVFKQAFRVSTQIAPIPIPGVWALPAQSSTRPSAGCFTVGFIGQPRESRAFPLFVATALALEPERSAGRVKFLAVIPPGSLETWRMEKFRTAFDGHHTGIACEERWMSSSDFVTQMNRADIVWALGDNSDTYLRQTSGIFAHGFCLDKKVITNRAGWAEASAGAVATCQYVEPTLDATTRAVRTLMSFQQDAGSREQATKWRALHSQNAFDGFVIGAVTTMLEGDFLRNPAPASSRESSATAQ